MRLVTVFFYLTSFFCYSQTVSGIVVSGKNSKPLVYSNITLSSKNKGTITNEEGSFVLNLDKEELNDSLLFSYIGYESKAISIRKFLNKQNDTIKLIEDVGDLDEIILSVKKARYGSAKTLGFNKRGIKRSSAPFGYEYTTLLENDEFVEGRVNNVIFYLKENKNDFYDKYLAYFRIKFYSYNQDLDIPEELLSHEDILIKPENKTQKIDLDVSEYNILMPREGIVVGIEVINPKIELPKNPMYVIAPSLMKTHTKTPLTWSSYRGKKWHKNKRKSHINNKFYTSMYFNLKVAFKK